MRFIQIKSILIKDFSIEYSYKFRFIYSILFIFLQITIFYFFSYFLETSFSKNANTPINNLFGFFIIGICFLDVSYTVISHATIKIEEYKRMGIFEEMFVLPIKPMHLIIFSNLYPILFSLFKLTIYLFFGYILFNMHINSLVNGLVMAVSIILGLIIFVGFSLIASSLTILFYRGTYVSSLHNTISVLFGGILYPISSVFENLYFIEYLIPLHALLDLTRYSLDIYSLNTQELYVNLLLLIFYAILILSVGMIALKTSLKKASIEGRLSLY